MIPSTNSIDDIDSTIDDVTYSNTCMLDCMLVLKPVSMKKMMLNPISTKNMMLKPLSTKITNIRFNNGCLA